MTQHQVQEEYQKFVEHMSGAYDLLSIAERWKELCDKHSGTMKLAIKLAHELEAERRENISLMQQLCAALEENIELKTVLKTRANSKPTIQIASLS